VKLVGTYAGKSVEWMAHIARNEGVIDNKSRMTYLVAEIQNPYLLPEMLAKNIGVDNGDVSHSVPLRFGAYVQAEILGIEIANASVLPRYLVVDDKVGLLSDESTLHYATISIIRQQGANVIVSNGLLDGDKLIVSALEYPVDGMKLALISDKKEPEEPIDEDTEVQVASTENEGE